MRTKKTEPPIAIATAVQPRMFTIKTAAEYLSATVWAVRSLIWNRELPAITIGKRIVISREALDAYIDSRMKAA
jgi:excisionase family DNA binding protein